MEVGFLIFDGVFVEREEISFGVGIVEVWVLIGNNGRNIGIGVGEEWISGGLIWNGGCDIGDTVEDNGEVIFCIGNKGCCGGIEIAGGIDIVGWGGY